MTSPRPFNFDNDFGAAGGSFGASAPVMAGAPKRKRVYLAEEVDEFTRKAFQEGEASAVVRAQQAQAQALAGLADAARAGLGALAQIACEHKTGAADLCLAAARVIADAALDRFPEAPIRAALESLAREIEAQPRLVVRMADPAPELQEAIEAAARDSGFNGQIAFRPEAGPVRAAFALEWGDGKAAFDPAAAAAARIAEAFAAALAAEGLHGEQLPADTLTGAV